MTDGIINAAPRALGVMTAIMDCEDTPAKVRVDVADKILGYTGWINREQKLTIVHEYRKLLEEVGLADVVDAEFVTSEGDQEDKKPQGEQNV